MSAQAAAPIGLRLESEMWSDRAGSAWCFEDSSPLDLELGGRKLLGSAARRRNGWVLFHGSLVIDAPRETPNIAALGREPDADAIAAALGALLGVEFRSGSWDDAERDAARRIRADRYGNPDFTHRR